MRSISLFAMAMFPSRRRVLVCSILTGAKLQGRRRMEIEEFITVLGGDTSSDRVCRRSCFRELLSPCGAAF
ncbi:hypothetical protein F2Q69_00032403 [Brassica cretica]|uniref:Uncharacterized protein n=1 Tax=Brassica cretica TaxID=69181 RepID=A0A8S9RVR1_BRACR|nr:hypothetical protein F2Q69_00032403 [Brassica cretica]